MRREKAKGKGFFLISVLISQKRTPGQDEAEIDYSPKPVNLLHL